MVRMPQLLSGDEFDDILFDVARRLTDGQAEPMRNAKNMRIDGESRFSECDRNNHVRRLAPNARKRFKNLPFARNFAAVFLYNCLRRTHDVARFDTEKADRLNDLLNFPDLGSRKRARVRIPRE